MVKNKIRQHGRVSNIKKRFSKSWNIREGFRTQWMAQIRFYSFFTTTVTRTSWHWISFSFSRWRVRYTSLCFYIYTQVYPVVIFPCVLDMDFCVVESRPMSLYLSCIMHKALNGTGRPEFLLLSSLFQNPFNIDIDVDN